jgi:hypothetical protein
MYEGRSKSKETYQKNTFIAIYSNETNITFQHNPPRLQRTGSSVWQIFLIPSEKKSCSVVSLTRFAPRQFVQRIVIADEICLHHYEPQSKAQSVAWKRPKWPVTKKYKSQPSAGKIMLTLFWDMEGEIFVHFTSKGETYNSQISICLAQWKKL